MKYHKIKSINKDDKPERPYLNSFSYLPINSNPSFTLGATGFSLSTCFPFSRARIMIEGCKVMGKAIITAWIFLFLSKASRSFEDEADVVTPAS